MTNTTCTFCKVKIYKRPSHMRLYKKHFCNAECQKQHERQTNTRVEVKCSQCDAPLTRSQQQLRKSKSRHYFCNNVCKNRFLIAERWKGKSNVKDHQHRRSKVIERCHNLCVNCGYDEDIRMLDIHHVDGNHQHNDFSNLWSICVWCHQEHHRCHKPIAKLFGV
jgi:hypothetical protein